MTLGKTTAFTLILWAFILGTSAPAFARAAPVTGAPNPAWINDSAPRLYQRPVLTDAFAGCEWVRVRAASGARWRALCN